MIFIYDKNVGTISYRAQLEVCVRFVVFHANKTSENMEKLNCLIMRETNELDIHREINSKPSTRNTIYPFILQFTIFHPPVSYIKLIQI
jgi:hypothetical protein